METIPLARWETRFWAWLIDIILISIIVNAVSTLVRTVFPFSPVWDIPVPGLFPFDLGLNSIVLFFYWSAFEGYWGKSIGKMALNIRVADRGGGKMGWGAGMIESFGKAFLLPLDCLIGWLAMPDTKLRLFNRLSNTIVIKTGYQPPPGVEYVIEKE